MCLDPIFAVIVVQIHHLGALISHCYYTFNHLLLQGESFPLTIHIKMHVKSKKHLSTLARTRFWRYNLAILSVFQSICAVCFP